MNIDIHFHPPTVQSDLPDCYITEAQQRVGAFRALSWMVRALRGTADNATARCWALDVFHQSTTIDTVVALAFDGVYNEGGLDLGETHFILSNEFVAEYARAKSTREKRILFGASVNPSRPDAVAALHRAYADGAVLNKFVPSAQDIDLADPRHTGFFEEMARLGLPLMVHVGVEHSLLSGSNPADDPRRQRLNDPARLELALSLGVKVIAAHCALPVWPIDMRLVPRSYATLRGLAARYPTTLYADVGALFVPFSRPRLRGVHEILRDRALWSGRLLFGSDFPMLAFPFTSGLMKTFNLLTLLRVALTLNPLDRNVRAFEALDFGPDLLTNAQEVLRIPAR